MTRRTALVVLAAVFAVGGAGCAGTKAKLRKADGYMEAGRYAAAQRAYEQVLERKPREHHALLGVARAWIADGQPGRAIPPAQVAVAAGAPGAHLVLAHALVNAGQGSRAVDTARSAIQEQPDAPEAHMLLARAHLAAGNLSAATEAGEAALQARGGPAAMALAGWMHTRAGNDGRATALASRAVGAAVDDPAVHGEAAAIFRYAGDGVAAKAAATTARTTLSQLSDPPNWLAVADTLQKGGDREGQVQYLALHRAVYTEDGQVAYALGVAWLELGVLDRAELELSAALGLAPYSTGEATGSIQVADRRSDALPEERRTAAIVGIQLALADTRAARGDAAGSAAARQQALALSKSRDAQQWLQLSRAWERAADYQQALNTALTAGELDQRDPNIHAHTARLYARLGDVGRAIGHARAAWELAPASPEAALLLAELYSHRDEAREAQDVLKATLKHHPDHAELRAALVRHGGRLP